MPVTVVERVSPESVSFVLRNLVHDEEEPGEDRPVILDVRDAV